MKRILIASLILSAAGLVAAPPRSPDRDGAPQKPERGQQARPQPPKKGPSDRGQQARPQPSKQGPSDRGPQARPQPQKKGPPPDRRPQAHGKPSKKGPPSDWGRHQPPPNHQGFHAGRPSGARFWSRPALPPPHSGARHAWSWIATPWSYTVDGVYYYGEGYYYDGYNYCYNGGYYQTPPPVQAATPPPPPPRSRGLLNILFGD